VAVALADTCNYRNGINMNGTKFFDFFNFWTQPDPTHGHVRFVDRATGQRDGLIGVQNGKVRMGADSSKTAPNGRESIRIESKQKWVNALYILDLDHMPGGACGIWPAFWTVGANWPNQGEIDIIEGVNKGDTNAMTLHTSNNCNMNTGRKQTGRALGTNCDTAATGNSGCGVSSTQKGSYATGFNSAGGGAYAMQRSGAGIKIWQFPKGRYPGDLLSNNPNPCNWPTPDAQFPFGGNCAASHFGPQAIVFDITFCGDWAGAVFGQQGCPGDCKQYVSNNPAAFKEAYWTINSLRVFAE